MMMPVRFAIVGVGVMGREHAQILEASPAAELVISCDKNPVAHTAVPDCVPFITNFDQALDVAYLEAVVIATPQSHHLTAVTASLERGLAVF